MALDNPDRGIQARRLIRSCDHAALATLLDSRPYVSLVATACDSDASPLLLLSDLAQHTKNLLAEPQVSLLFDDTAGLPDRLAGPRLPLLGRGRGVDGPGPAGRFVPRPPPRAGDAELVQFPPHR